MGKQLLININGLGLICALAVAGLAYGRSQYYRGKMEIVVEVIEAIGDELKPRKDKEKEA